MPVPSGLEAKYQKNIIGVGAQMWTEWTPTYKDVEYKTFPRIAAIAEIGWTGSRDYEDFDDLNDYTSPLYKIFTSDIFKNEESGEEMSI